MRTVSRVVLFFLGLVWVGPWLAAEMPIPVLHRRVTDLTGTLSSVQQNDLENTLADFERNKGSQVAVLIVPTTQPETIEQYSIRVASQWKLGRKGVDDGALLLVAKEDRALRIEVGYGLEGVLPDVICKRIIEEFVVPLLKAGDFAGGIQAGVSKILGIVQGEPLPPPPPLDSVGFHLLDGFGIFVLFGVLIFLRILFGGSFIGSGRGGWTSGGGSGGGLGGGGGFGGGGGGFGGGGASGRW